MNHDWQQPIRPLEFRFQHEDGSWSEWLPVLFVRPRTVNGGWEIMSFHGVIHENTMQRLLRPAE